MTIGFGKSYPTVRCAATTSRMAKITTHYRSALRPPCFQAYKSSMCHSERISGYRFRSLSKAYLDHSVGDTRVTRVPRVAAAPVGRGA